MLSPWKIKRLLTPFEEWERDLRIPKGAVRNDLPPWEQPSRYYKEENPKRLTRAKKAADRILAEKT